MSTHKNRVAPPAPLSWRPGVEAPFSPRGGGVDDDLYFEQTTPRSAPIVIQEDGSDSSYFAAIPPLHAPRHSVLPRGRAETKGVSASLVSTGTITPFELELSSPPEPVVRSMAFGDYTHTLRERLLAHESMLAGDRRPDSVLPMNHSRHSPNATSAPPSQIPDARESPRESFFDSLPKKTPVVAPSAVLPRAHTQPPPYTPAPRVPVAPAQKEDVPNMTLFHAGHPLRALTLAILAVLIAAATSACLIALVKLMITRSELNGAAIQEIVQRPYVCSNCFLPDQSTHSMCTECKNAKNTFPTVAAHARYREITSASYSVNVQPFLGDALEKVFEALVSSMFHATDAAALLAYLFVAFRLVAYLLSAGPYAYVIARRDRIEMRALRSRYPTNGTAGPGAPTRSTSAASEVINGGSGFKHE